MAEVWDWLNFFYRYIGRANHILQCIITLSLIEEDSRLGFTLLHCRLVFRCFAIDQGITTSTAWKEIDVVFSVHRSE